MMFQEEGAHHRAGKDEEEGGMNVGRRTQGEIGEPPVGDVPPAAVVTTLSEYLPHSKDQTPKKRGRPKKILLLKEVNQRAKDVSERGVLLAESGTFKAPCQQPSTNLDTAFENGPKGSSNQEQGIALSTKKCSNMLMNTLAGEQQVTPTSSGPVPTVQDDFPPFSVRRHSMTKSNTETRSKQDATERMCRKPDRYPGGGEGRNVVAHTPWISNLSEKDKVKGESDARLHASARLLQNSWGGKCQGQGRERGIAVEQQEKIIMAESVMLTETPTWTCEETDKFRDCHSSSVMPNVSQSDTLQCAEEAVKGLVDAVVPHEPMVKHGPKGGPPKRSMLSKMQVRQAVGGPKDHGNYLEENSTCEKRNSSFYQRKGKLGEWKMKESDKSFESIQMGTAVNKDSSKTDVRLVDTNVCQVPSVSFSRTGSDPVTCPLVNPKKKFGRPQKKHENIETEGTIGILGTDCNVSVKESVETSLKDLSDKKALEKTDCVQKTKRGRGRYARKPVCIIPRQEQVVGMVIESTAETRTPPRKRDQEVIGGKRVTGTQCKGSTLLELKATAVPTPVRPLPHVQRKRGRQKKIICLNEKTPNSFEPQNCSVSQQVILPPSKTKSQNKGMAEMSATFGSVKATGKEKSAVVRQRGNGGSIAVSCRNREAEVKFKRKIGRPFKRKTLIKMAKQLELPQLRTAKATDMYEENHPENIPYQTHKYRLKRERKTVELYSQVSQLRRYSRACKLNANYSAEKQEHHPASSRKRLLSSVSKIPVPNLDSEKMVSPSSAVLSVSKKGSVTTKSEGRDCLKVTWKKGKHLKNKMKRKVNIKVEEIQQPVLTALSKIKNPSAFQEILPMLSKETTAVSGSARSTEKKPLTNCKMRSKAKQINQLQFSAESGQSLRAQSLCQIHNDTAAAKVALPVLIHKAEFEETEVMSHKGTHNVTVKKIQGKGRMSQKKVTVKCEPRLDAAVINDSESHSPFLPSQRFIESTKSGDKGPQIHGRQCKNEALVPTVKFREEVKKDVAYESLTDQSYHPSQECPLQSSGKVMSCLKISANSEMKRPRKVDRRRKWFRHQKAQELKALSEVKPTEPVGQFTSQIDSREEVLSVTQKHSSKRKLETGDQLFNDSDPFTKRPRKAFGSRKRRRRKRSWWDDRGKGKGEIPDAMLKPSLPSVEGKAEVEVVVKSDFDVKITANQESNTSYQPKMQNSNELPSHTQVVPQRSGTDRISEVVYFSDQINLSTSHNTEKSQKNIFADETEKKPFHDNSISENQRLASDPENQDDQTLPIKNLGPLPEPCKITVDMASDELQEKERRNKTNTSTSPALNDEVNTLETDSLEPDPLVKAEITRQKSRRSRNEDDRQTQIVTTEENALRDHSVLLNPKEVDQVETKVEMFVSSESKTLNPANLRSSKTLSEEDGLCDVFLNTPDVEKKQTMSLQQNVLIQDLPQDKKGWENYKDGVDQSDQEVEEGYVEEDPVESMEEEELPVTSHSKARRPGRPAKDKGKKPIECQFCGRPFHHISAYVIHRRVHTGERPYSCQECGKTFAQLSNLNTHRKTHKVSGDLHGLLSEQEELLDHCQKHAPGPEKRDHLTRQVGNEEGGDKKQYRSFPYSKDGKPHICSVCGKGFRYTSMLKIHMRVHSGEKPYSCKVCGKSFSQACSVSVHEKIHWSIKPYVCNFCGKGFSQLGTLRTHFYSHVGVYKDGGKQVSNKVTFQCQACNKSFSIWHQYNFHLKSHLDVQFFACDICGRQYRQMCDLSFHRQSCGKQIIEETVRHTLESDTLQESRKLKGQPFQPHVLQYSQLQSNYQHQRQGKQAFSPSDLTSQRPLYQLPEHKTFPELMNPQPQRDASQQRNHSSRSKCWQMPNPAYSQMIIKSPRKRHPSRHPLSTSVHLDRKFDPRKYLCPRCGRLFRHLGRLRAHMLTHIRGHSYTCGRCGKTLENWNKFWLHQRVHRQKQGRFFCPKCGQGFRFAGMYKQHLQEHKELTVFACSSCPQTFSHQEVLKAHRRDQHKPHKCNVCGKRFHLQGNLQRHNLVHRHTHPECCPHCSLLFASVTCLQDHMMTHKSPAGPLLDMSAQQNVLPYQCGECESSFKNLDLLFRHQLSHPPPRDRKPWRNGEIVGLQKKSPYVFAPLDDPSVYPSSSSSVAQVSAHYTNPSSHEGSVISHTYSPDHFQLASNKPSHPSKLPSLENNAHLPQTLSPSAAVPFSDAQPLPQYPQTSTSVQSPSHNQDQTSHKCEKPFPQKPLRTYEKSKRGVASAPSSSVKPHNEENCRDSIACAECGAQFNVVPELYEHYLQHARGEL